MSFQSLFPILGNSGAIVDTADTKRPLDFAINGQAQTDRYLTQVGNLSNTATKGSHTTAAKQAAKLTGDSFNIGLKSKYQLMAAQQAANLEGIQQRHQQGIMRVQGQIQNQRSQHGIAIRMMGAEQSAQVEYTETIFHVLDHGSHAVANALMQ